MRILTLRTAADRLTAAAAIYRAPLGAWVTIGPPPHTDAQRRAYWAILHEIAANLWMNDRRYDAEAWHELFKREYIGVDRRDCPDGTYMLRGRSTKTLDREEFAVYVTKILAEVTEMGMEFGDAGEYCAMFREQVARRRLAAPG